MTIPANATGGCCMRSLRVLSMSHIIVGEFCGNTIMTVILSLSRLNEE